jgi:hypothetical protein
MANSFLYGPDQAGIRLPITPSNRCSVLGIAVAAATDSNNTVVNLKYFSTFDNQQSGTLDSCFASARLFSFDPRAGARSARIVVRATVSDTQSI